MGVLACHRNGCENIMCDRVSREYGYICNECFKELVFTGPETNIESFMDSKKQNIESAKARFGFEFKWRD